MRCGADDWAEGKGITSPTCGERVLGADMTCELNSVVRRVVRMAVRKQGGKVSHRLIMSAARARGADISKSQMHARHINHVWPMFLVSKMKIVIGRGTCATPRSPLKTVAETKGSPHGDRARVRYGLRGDSGVRASKFGAPGFSLASEYAIWGELQHTHAHGRADNPLPKPRSQTHNP